ncbi:MAG: YicC family protein [Clostridiales bacterium]|nr:YicC family protein [Clostridiales bacterium]
MAYSMTGFGRAEKIVDTRRYNVELKSVNSRYCDINLRLPRILNFMDADIRKAVTAKLNRGKIDMFISFEDLSGAGCEVLVNETLANEYSLAIKKVSELTGREDDTAAGRIALMQDVMVVGQQTADEEVISGELMECVNDALDAMAAMRKTEGDRLKDDILAKTDALKTIRDEIEQYAPTVIETYRKKLSDRIDDLLKDDNRQFYDESRLAAEVALFADKCAVDEELTRLSSHFAQVPQILANDGAVGKQMDFLIQEINREINTTGSKANDIEITNRVLRMKNIVEEMREQVQNLV